MRSRKLLRPSVLICSCDNLTSCRLRYCMRSNSISVHCSQKTSKHRTTRAGAYQDTSNAYTWHCRSFKEGPERACSYTTGLLSLSLISEHETMMQGFSVCIVTELSSRPVRWTAIPSNANLYPPPGPSFAFHALQPPPESVWPLADCLAAGAVCPSVRHCCPGGGVSAVDSPCPGPCT